MNVCPLDVGKYNVSIFEALVECKNKIAECEKNISAYVALKERLQTFHENLNYQVMVPMTSVAFMPGKIIHTNEVLALLGDNWFVECSSAYAVGIVERRLKYLKEKLDAFKEEERLYGDRQKFVELLNESGDYVEIRERLDDSSYKKATVPLNSPHIEPHNNDYRPQAVCAVQEAVEAEPQRQYRVQIVDDSEVVGEEEPVAGTPPGLPRGVSREDYEAVMRRLDELEKQENEDSDDVGSENFESDEEPYQQHKLLQPCSSRSAASTSNHVLNAAYEKTFEFKEPDTECEASSVREYKKVHWDEDNIAAVSEFTDVESTPATPMSSTPAAAELSSDSNAPCTSGLQNENTETLDEEPVYTAPRRNSEPVISLQPKSILKASNYKMPSNIPPPIDHYAPELKTIVPGSAKAFSGTVIERQQTAGVCLNESEAITVVPSSSSSRAATQRVSASKFRQLRNLQALL